MEYGTTINDGQRLRRVTVTGNMDFLKNSTESREKEGSPRETKKGALGKAVTTFGDTTTAHGLPLIINGGHVVARALWTLIWLACFGLALFQCVLLLGDFFTWPATANIKLVTETNLDFPAVTVCNMNRMRRSELVGTRFEGLIAIDGGIQGGDYDYSWFFDWSSDWFDEWDVSSSSSVQSSNADSSADYTLGSADDDNTGSVGASSQEVGDGTASSVSASVSPDWSSVHSSTASTTSQSGLNEADNGTNGSTTEEGSSIDSGNGSQVEGSVGETSDGNGQVTDSLGEQAGTSPSESPTSNPLDPTSPTESTFTAMEYLSTAAVTSDNSLPTHSGPTEGAEAISGSVEASSSFSDGSSSSTGSARRRRSTDSDERSKRSTDSDKRSRRSVSSSSGYWWDSYDFDYLDYYDWEGVTDENDWSGFYSRSKADDFSDMVDIANPTREELERLGHQAEDFILQCTFDKRNCSYRDFRVFQNRDYGNCFTFNHGKENDTVRKTSKFGAKYGLHLTLFIEQPEYIGIFSPESGVRVAIHDQKTMPLPEDNGITAATGLASSIGVRQDYIERLGLPYGNCSDGTGTDFNSSVAGDYAYSVSACSKYCLQRAMLDRCGCVTDILIDYAPKCSFINITQQTCRQAVETLYEDDLLGCTCHTACRETRYRMSLSSSRWPSERYEEHLYSRISAVNSKAGRLMQNIEQTRKNMVRLRIYFEELNYQSTIQTEKYSIETLLGSLGGLFGLYIGFSVITLTEVVLFLLKVLKILLGWGQRSGHGVQPAVY